jgi:hypothetical protein
MKLKKLATIKTFGEQVVVASATGKFKGDIFFLSENTDLNDVDEWFLNLPSKELEKLVKNEARTNNT